MPFRLIPRVCGKVTSEQRLFVVITLITAHETSFPDKQDPRVKSGMV